MKTRFDCGVCVLRKWRVDDIEPLVSLANDWNVSHYMADLFPFPYTLDDARWWIDRHANDASTHFAIEAEGVLAGGIGYEPLAAERRCGVHIGYWLGKPFWGRGIATAACGALSDALLAMDGILRVETFVYSPNVASMRVLEKCGFVREGLKHRAAVKGDEVFDTHLYAKVREE